MPIQDIWPKTAPDVTGDDQTTAEAVLDALLIPYTYDTPQSSDTVPSGDVVSQNPAGGATMNLGDSMTLVLSLGNISWLTSLLNLFSDTWFPATLAVVLHSIRTSGHTKAEALAAIATEADGPAVWAKRREFGKLYVRKPIP